MSPLSVGTASASMRYERTPSIHRKPALGNASSSPIEARGAAGNSETSNPEAASSGAPGQTLSPQEQREVQRLQQIDRQVRAHEAAHLAAGAGVVSGGARFETVRGPDGQSYAVAGEVPIDASKGGSPEETLRKAEIIRRAALAPADPSGPDQAAAAKAAQMAAEASREIALRERAEREGNAGASATVNTELPSTGPGRRVGQALALYESVSALPGSNA